MYAEDNDLYILVIVQKLVCNKINQVAFTSNSLLQVSTTQYVYIYKIQELFVIDIYAKQNQNPTHFIKIRVLFWLLSLLTSEAKKKLGEGYFCRYFE